MQFDASSIASVATSVIIFSLVSTFLPRESLWIVAIAYIVIFAMFTSLLQRLRNRKRAPEAKGTVLIRSNEKAVMEIVMRDQELFRELSKQTWGMLLMMLISLPIFFIIIPVLHPWIISNDVTIVERFLRNLAFYSIISCIMYAMRLVFMPKKMIIPITKYEILSTGIKCNRIWIPFPLDKKRYRIAIDHRRGFVEIHDLRTNQVHRLYSEDAHKLYSLIEKHGFKK